VPDTTQAATITKFMSLTSVDDIETVIDSDDDVAEAIADLKAVLAVLEVMGVADYCVFDPSIVRGLAYYTGVVFEVHDIVGELRAICGGGRYDNLLKDFGGPAVSATGMGMGDCVLEILLQQKGRIDDRLFARHLEYFVACADPQYSSAAYEVTAQIRSRGHSANFSYKLGGLSKQLKEAASQNAYKCVIIGQEYAEKKELVVKDMATGQQTQVGAEAFFPSLIQGGWIPYRPDPEQT